MLTLAFDYIYWHFFVAPKGILNIARNYLVATWYRFLIAEHARTLFAPWHRRQPSDLLSGKTKTMGDKILDSIADFYIRILAAFIRLSLILAGLIWELLIILTLCIGIIIWLAWPLVFIFMLTMGLNLLIK